MKKDIKLAIGKAEKILHDSNISEAEANNVLMQLKAASEDAEPWYVILLKVLAYLIGLLLAGMGTASAATMVIR